MSDDKLVYVPGKMGPQVVLNCAGYAGIEGTKEQFRELYDLLKEMFKADET